MGSLKAIQARMVEDLIRECSGVARVFMDRRMACVGCPMAAFETLEDAARAYGIAPRSLARQIAAELRRSPSGLSPATTDDATGFCARKE